MGVDVRAASKLMGHADIRTTANIYTHQDNETLRQAAEKMGVVSCVVPSSTGIVNS
jgi:site-specific recombinase XerD